MLREIIREIVARQADMDVVGDFAAPLPLRDAVVSCDAEFVIAGAEFSGADDVGPLLEEHPDVKVLAVEGDGREAFLWELRPKRVPLGEVSPQTLLHAIRGVRA